MAIIQPCSNNNSPQVIRHGQGQMTEAEAWRLMMGGTTQRSDDIYHSFSRDLAKSYGVTAAILLQYLAYRISSSKHVIDGNTWYYETIDSLAERYSYLPASTIHDNLQGLTGKVLLTKRYNKKSYDRTTWYAFIQEATRRAAMENPLYFAVKDARAHGVNAAILLNNMRYWIEENRKEQPQYRWHRMSPYELENILPLSRSAIARALTSLVDTGVLVRNPESQGRASEYGLADSPPTPPPSGQEGEGGDGQGGVQGAPPDLKSSSPNSEMTDSLLDSNNPRPDGINSLPDGNNPNLDTTSSFSDMTSSFSDNNTYYIDPIIRPVSRQLIDCSKNYLKNSFRESTAQPSSSCDCASFDEQENQITDNQGQDISLETLRNQFDQQFEQFTQKQRESCCDNLMQCAVLCIEKLEESSFLELLGISDWGVKYHRVCDWVDHCITNRILPTRPDYDSRPLKFWTTLAFHRFCHNQTEYCFPYRGFSQTLTYVMQRYEPHRERKAEEERQRKASECYEERERRLSANISPTKDKETIATLSAREKVRVLKNYIDTKNKIGCITPEKTLKTNYLSYHNGSMEAAKRFFEANPSVPVSALVDIWDACQQCQEFPLPPGEEKDELFYVRRATTLSFYLIHLQDIMKELNWDGEYNILFCIKDELFGKQEISNGQSDAEATSPCTTPEEPPGVE